MVARVQSLPRRRLAYLLGHLESETVAAAGSQKALSSSSSSDSRGAVRVVPVTPAIGADVYGYDLAEGLTEPEIAEVDALIRKHKVLFFRDQSEKMSTEDQLRFVRNLGSFWDLERSPNRTPQAELCTQDKILIAPIFPQKLDEEGQVVHPGVVTVGSRASVKEAQPVAYPKFGGQEARASGAGTTTPTEKAGGGGSAEKKAIMEPKGQLPRAVGDTRIPEAKIWNDVALFPTGTILKKRLSRSRLQGERGRGTWRRYGQEELFSGNVWHTDNQWMENPPWVTVLRAISLPENGGDTCFANMEAVYNDLDDATQEYLATLTQITDWEVLAPGVRLAAERKKDFAALNEMKRKFPPAEHPVIRTHPQTGAKSVNVNPMYCQGLKGMSEEEAAPLLRELYALTNTPEYTCRLRWEPGTVALWDNRCVQHYATADYGEQQTGGKVRVLEHTGSMGDKPF